MRSSNTIQISRNSVSSRNDLHATKHWRSVGNTLELLESRRLLAVSAISAGGVLTVLGDKNANAITVSRDAAGNLLVNKGAVQIAGATATIANINLINIFGFAGNDSLALDEANGALPRASLVGGDGKDALTGGSGADVLSGGAGNDALRGMGGDDSLFGGSSRDLLIGGVGTDQVFGQSGADLMVWNPGEGSDLNEGGAGIDTVEVNGAAANESFTAEAVNGRVLFKRIDPGPFSIDIGSSESLVLKAGAGNDSFAGGIGLSHLIAFTIDGGAGNDSLNGTDGADTLIGGDGNDFVDGNGGADVAQLGAGDDVFQWDPGDGSDIVEGQSGADKMIFNGANGNENIDISANGNRLRFFRDAGNITMDTDDVESVQFNALGGVDNVIVHDLAATDVTQLIMNLAAAAGGVDGQADSVIVEGTSSDDAINVASNADGVSVNGLAASVQITNAEPSDKLSINALAGDDSVDASALAANAISFAANGGAGDDVLRGGAGNDSLSGGAGDDVLFGGDGQDQLDGGSGDSVVIQ